MALQTANQYQLGPNVQPVADRITQIIQRKQNIERQDKLLAEKRQMEEAQRKMLSLGTELWNIREMDDAGQRKALSLLAQQGITDGENIDLYEQALAIQDHDERNTFLSHHALKAQEIAEKVLAQNMREGTKYQFGGQVEFKDEDDNLFYGTTIRDPSGAVVISNLTPVNPSQKGLQPVGKLSMVGGTGETADEKLRREIELAAERESLKTGGEIERESEKKRIEEETAAKIAGEKERGKSEIQRLTTQIDEGIAAADSIPVLKRSLSLLNEGVETGGWNNVALKVSNFFGVTGENEAELSANLGRAVLSQLRKTFGAAFTEREGDRLAFIEASFGKSTKANIRLLEQLQRMAEREVKRGIRAAEKAGDEEMAQEMRDMLDFNLDPENQASDPLGIR